MRIIAHRANLFGSDESFENKISSIKKAISLNFDVEIDVWKIDNEYYLGHNGPEEKVELNFFLKYYKWLWIHAKNLEALNSLKNHTKLNYFWHEKDKYTLTSKCFIWAYPGMDTTNNTIIVNCDLKEIDEFMKNKECLGICTDYPVQLQQKILPSMGKE